MKPWPRTIQKGDIDLLREDFERLADRTQTLLTEKLLLENEVTQLSKRASRLEEDLRHLKSPPLVVGNVQDIVDDRAIVKSSNGTVFLVTYNPRLEASTLVPGARSHSEPRYTIHHRGTERWMGSTRGGI